MHVSWNLSGSQCIVSDRKGVILLIDVRLNTWKKIAQMTLVPAVLEFGLAKTDEFLVALPNCEIRCFNTSGALMSIMGGHKTQVSAIRVAPDGKEAISISSDIAHVWNLASFERLRKMQINPQTPLVDLCYLNDGQTATIFRNSAIFIWKGEQCLLQIKQPAEANFKINRMIFSQGL